MMKKYLNCVYNLTPITPDDMATADIDRYFARILVRKKAFMPKPRRQFKIKPIVKNGSLKSIEIRAPYGYIKQFFCLLNYQPLIDEDFYTQNRFGMETGYIYCEEWENQNIFKTKHDKGDK